MTHFSSLYYFRHRVRRKEIYRARSHTSRTEGPGNGSGLMLSPGCKDTSRNEELMEVAWQVQFEPVQSDRQPGVNFGCTIENSFHSTVDSGRDSGAGDSTSDLATETKENLPLVSIFDNKLLITVNKTQIFGDVFIAQLEGVPRGSIVSHS